MSGPKSEGAFAYLLRGWEERLGDEDSAEDPCLSSWRFSLEDPHTGARYGFASLALLTAALERRMERKEEE
ncbi:MAG TPA: hypothetical protein VF168_09040 [Trueperaceae bacterium]